MNMTKTWYIRSHSNAEIKGPFPGGQISQEILLGRHQLDDEVSHDKNEWFMIREVPELVPSVFTEDRDEPGFNDRLAAARRWADERRGTEAIDELGERRANESYETKEIKRLHSLASKVKMKNSPLLTLIQLSAVFIIITFMIVLAFEYSPKEKKLVDCSAPAKQGVNWEGCNLSGANLVKAELIAANLMNTNLQTADFNSANLSLANLKYAQLHLANLKFVNLSKANLQGANLMGADLSGALLDQANFSYANFRDAIVGTANFSNTRLDNAIWTDGRTCGKNSIDSCK